jgi:hypothetical protein
MFGGVRNRVRGIDHIPEAPEGSLAKFGFCAFGVTGKNVCTPGLNMQERSDSEHCITETDRARICLFVFIILLDRVHDLFHKHQLVLLAVFAISCPA